MVPFFVRSDPHHRVADDPGQQRAALWFLRTFHLVGLSDAVMLTDNGSFLNTPQAVIGGLTYNFVPFMILPIYVSLEKIDRR